MGTKTSDTKSDKFEVEIKRDIEQFFSTQDEPYKSLKVSRYEGSDTKFYSDIKITNPKTKKNIWIEVKENKYACFSGPSMKYRDGKWECTTTDEEDPIGKFYVDAITKGAEKFIQFCKEYLKKDDISLPKDLSKELITAWKDNGSVEDTDNDVQFITDKIPLDDFGQKIADYYKTGKYEPVYYMQVDDELYIIDQKYNPLGLKTKSGGDLKPLSDAYRIGRIQFRAKGLDKKLKDGNKYYYSIVCDVKILADDREKDDYSCSFKSKDKWPMVERYNTFAGLEEAEKDIGGKKSDKVPDNGVKIWIDDIREAPNGFKWIKSVNDFIDYCHENGIDNVSLIDTDHDAGDFKKYGGDYIKCFKYLDVCGSENVTIHIHSANPVGANNIRKLITKNKNRGWKEIRNS